MQNLDTMHNEIFRLASHPRIKRLEKAQLPPRRPSPTLPAFWEGHIPCTLLFILNIFITPSYLWIVMTLKRNTSDEDVKKNRENLTELK